MRALCDFTAVTSGHPWFAEYRTRDNKSVDFLSTISLLVETIFEEENGNEQILATGSSFIVENSGSQYLITNWHIVTGLNAEDGCTLLDRKGRRPNKLRICHHSEGGLGLWVKKDIRLFGDMCHLQDHCWLEHNLGHQVDVVAIRLTELIGARNFSLNLSAADDSLLVTPSEVVSIIGFPEGKSAEGGFPIWKTGHVASDIALNDRRFNIDATTKSGMSGSPVFAKRTGYYMENFKDVSMGTKIRFLGVYSGRISDTADIGNVWHPAVINEIISA